jgi:PGF-pre-PGF domain-containing protein
MKINKQKLITVIFVAILVSFIPLVAAAPSGTSESIVVDAAKSWIGVKDVHGGNNRSGIDCSHLVYQLYEQAGAIDIVFQKVREMKKNAYYVNTTSPTPGDVIFWQKDVTKNNKTYWLAAHVGIYMGNEQFIDTSFDTKTVAIESISGVYKDGLPYYAKWDTDGNDALTKVANVTANNKDSNLPVAEFSASPTSGNAPLKVAFTDSSTGATSWAWDFGDGGSSTERNPTHTYSSAGNYNVNLTVSNETETASKVSTISILEESSSSDSSGGSSDSSSDGSSHHSSDGGGGSVGSPEPAKNVQVKENSQTFISSGEDVTFNFTKNATCVESIAFRSTKTVGKTATIVEELKNKSSLVSGVPEGIVYKLFNLWVGNDGYGNSKNIENSSVNFKVNTSWVNENNISKSSITLNKYDDKKKEWVELPVNLTGEDNQFLHFTANVPGYSSFAITCKEGERNAIAAEPAQITKNSTAGSNASTIANKVAEENKNTPGFSIISGIVCLFCIFLYGSKKR